jgi:hypothetical protein
MPIITISREYGSGGSEVAARVASALGWHLYDNDVVEQVAARLGVSSTRSRPGRSAFPRSSNG